MARSQSATLLFFQFSYEPPAGGFEETEGSNAGHSSVGTGPYRFESWSSGESLRLIRNDDYWGSKPTWRDGDVPGHREPGPPSCGAQHR